MKKALVLMVVGVLAFSGVGCANTTSSNVNKDDEEVLVRDETAEKEIENGLTLLKNKQENYIIENAIEAADDTIYNIVVNTDKGSYTEYPVDADGNYGTLVFGSSDSMTYNISDWLNKDSNEYYLFVSKGDEDSVIYKLNEAYSAFMQTRRYFYVDYMLPNFTYIKATDPISYQDNTGTLHSLKCYECGLPADKIKDILSAQSYMQYKYTAEDENCSDDVRALLKYYLKQLDRPLTFADGRVLIGLDDDGMISYVGMETGGAGNYFYYTQYMIEPDATTNLRDVPDFSNAVPYEDQFKEIAAFVSTYPTTAEGVKALDVSQMELETNGGTVLTDDGLPDDTDISEEENSTEQSE